MSRVRSAPFLLLLPLVACTDPVIGSWELDTIRSEGCTIDGDLDVDEALEAEFDINLSCDGQTDLAQAEGDVTVKADSRYTMVLVADGEPNEFDCELDGDFLTCDDDFGISWDFERVN